MGQVSRGGVGRWSAPAVEALCLVGLLATLSGCEAPVVEDDEPVPGPCDEAWGDVPASGRVHVDAAAPEGGDGSAEAPFAALLVSGVDADGDGSDDLDSGLEAARAGGQRQIVLSPGEYPGSYGLSEAEWGDAGLEIAGCGIGSTVLVGVTELR